MGAPLEAYRLLTPTGSLPPPPVCAQDLKVFVRERLNGYYGVSQFTVANTLASLPFIFIIAVLSSMAVYWISGLNSSGGSVIYFILALFMSLVVTEASSHTHKRLPAVPPQPWPRRLALPAGLLDGRQAVGMTCTCALPPHPPQSIMMAIAPLVPNFLMGIAAGAGLLGLFMIVCGEAAASWD